MFCSIFRAMKQLYFTLLVCLFASAPLRAQLQDDFSDGDFNTGTVWLGDAANFTVNAAKELQLNAPAPLPSGSSDTSQIYTFVNFPDSVIWDFYLRLGFAPSTSNQSRIYLQADQNTLANSNAYYLELGETNADTLKLFRQDANGTITKVAVCTQGFSVSIKAKIRVTRTFSGVWNIFTDYSGGNNLTLEASATDNIHKSVDAQTFGFWCKYTSGNKDKFFFDDIKISSLLPDSQPPVLLGATVANANLLDVTFNEKLDNNFASNKNNFSINQGIGAPAAAALDAVNKNILHLTLQNPLPSNQYILTVTNAKDTVGNVSSVAQITNFAYISFQTADRFDLLLNEIMADPTPTIGSLPAVEYIEIYNRSNKTINLSGFQLSNGNVTRTTLPYYALQPKQYLVIFDNQQNIKFPTLDTLSVTSLISFSNDGDDVSLIAPNGDVVDAVTYDISWYQNTQKAAGGWSLERINPSAPCDNSSSNWSACSNPNGGTPGFANSVLKLENDTKSPNLSLAFPSSSTEILVTFDEGLDASTASTASNYTISDGIAVLSAALQNADNKQVKLILQNPLQTNTVYTFTAKVGIKDCAGNALLQNATLRLAIPQTPIAKDIIINEVLFNAPTGGVDFVELYNRSKKVVNVSELRIGNFANGNQSIQPISANYLLFPNEYIALTPKIVTTKNSFFVKNPTALLENALPTLDDKAGNVTLFTSGIFNINIIDSLDYDESWHNALLSDKNGVSLERVNPSLPTNDKNNWQSAAASVGYATPTYKNSQYLESSAPAGTDIFTLAKDVFSPDGDGYEDFLSLDYQTDRSGYLASVRIFDSSGRLVKNLLKNELLATQGSLRWDGDLDSGSKARIGIYILHLQITAADGTVKEQKLTCVVAAKL